MFMLQVGVAVHHAFLWTRDHDLQQLQVTCKGVHAFTGLVVIEMMMWSPVHVKHNICRASSVANPDQQALLHALSSFTVSASGPEILSMCLSAV